MDSKVEAGYLILKERNRALSTREITRIALARGMIETVGKTPWATLGADFYNENKRRTRQGRELRFVRVGAGLWGLAEWGLEPAKERPKAKEKRLKC